MPLIHHAAGWGSLRATHILLAAGADETGQNEDGRSTIDTIGLALPSEERDAATEIAIRRICFTGDPRSVLYLGHILWRWVLTRTGLPSLSRLTGEEWSNLETFVFSARTTKCSSPLELLLIGEREEVATFIIAMIVQGVEVSYR